MKKFLLVILLFSLSLFSFAVSEYGYATDEKAVYYDGNIIINSDPYSFEEMERGNYGKDKNSVYYMGKKVAEADSKTSEIVKDSAVITLKIKIMSTNQEEKL